LIVLNNVVAIKKVEEKLEELENQLEQISYELEQEEIKLDKDLVYKEVRILFNNPEKIWDLSDPELKQMLI
jgi:hypothetical protein